MGMTFKFGELDAILADVQVIPSSSRSAFAARLKNLHRLGFPHGVEQQGRGKAITYTVGDLALMAIAIEMSQLGLTPERAIGVIEADPYPLLMALMMGADAALGAPTDEFVKKGTPEKKQPLSMFLYFDPAALAPWKFEGGREGEDWASATFFYGGLATVRDRLADWTTSWSTRMSMINVSYLLWQMASLTTDRAAFLREVSTWADGVIRKDDFDLDAWITGPARQACELVKNGAKVSLPRNLPASKLIRRSLLGKTYYWDKKIRNGNTAVGEADVIIQLPGERELMLDAALSSATPKSLRDIKERVNHLVARPFQTQFTDTTKYTLMYIEQDDLDQALAEEPDLWDEAFDAGVVIISARSIAALLDGINIVWVDYNTKEKRRGNHS